MKITGLILFLLATVAASAQTDQPTWNVCRNPVRVFKGKATVNLTPLFEWWKRQPLVITNKSTNTDMTASPESERPLSDWYRVTGTKVGTIGPSWVVDAVIYTSPTISTNARIILNNPPTVEEVNYNALKQQQTVVEQQIVNTESVYEENTNAEAQAMATLEIYRRSWSKTAPDGVRDYSALASKKHNAAALALTQLDRLEAAREQIETQLKAIPEVNGAYHIDWFALLLGRSKHGVPIYDMGLVSANPP